MPWSYAAFKMGSASASSMHQGSHFESPKDMAPRTGFEIRRPEEPRRINFTAAAGVVMVTL